MKSRPQLCVSPGAQCQVEQVGVCLCEGVRVHVRLPLLLLQHFHVTSFKMDWYPY